MKLLKVSDLRTVNDLYVTGKISSSRACEMLNEAAMDSLIKQIDPKLQQMIRHLIDSRHVNDYRKNWTEQQLSTTMMKSFLFVDHLNRV